MGHADDDLLDAGARRPLHDVVEQRNQGVAAFEREALLADVARVQVALEALGRRELLEEVQAFVVREAMVQPPFLEAVLQPEALLGRRDVRELGADAARVDLPELLQDLRQLHLLVDAARAARRVELRLHVGLGEADVGRIQHARHGPLHEAERIDVRDQVAAVGVELDEARDGGLLRAVRGRRGVARERRLTAAAGPAPIWPLQADACGRSPGPNWPKKSRHSGLTLAGVREEALVLVFDVRRLRARERARFVEFAQGAAHGPSNYTNRPHPNLRRLTSAAAYSRTT